MSEPRSAPSRAALATLDPALGAKILSRKPLRYRRGGDAGLDRPAHVRASSALCWVGGELGRELLVLQDDAAFLGIVDAASGLVEDVPLAASAGGHRVFDARRGNKADKPDFELAFGAGDTLYALGSGGLAARQRVLRWRRGAAPELVALPRLYARLRQAVVGEANLNLEGAALLGEQVVLANRGGDGSVGGAGGSPDALVRLPLAQLIALLEDPEGAALPELCVERVALHGLASAAGGGALHPLRFTDLSPRSAGRGGGLWYLAAAEQTDNFYDDGHVVGSAIGIVRFADSRDGGAGGGGGGAVTELRYAPICDEGGAPSADKVEGVCEHARPDRLWAVTDPDDPDRPGELLELELSIRSA